MTTSLISRRSRVTSALFALCLGSSGSFGQTVPVPPPSTASAASQDATVLSPFEVRADLDTGYLATSAQSGTRLRTDLKDIASSVSVITKDLMNDIGAKDLEGLLTYTLGTEVGGSMGNYSDAGAIVNPNGTEIDYDAAFSNALPAVRLRGLTTADNARDFFITGAPLDGYNTERIEITRGANAMLFGLGSPAGIINTSLITANLTRRRTELEHRTDTYGSQRGSLDHNHVLIKDKLALRFATVYERQYYRVEEAYEKDRRAFLTGTYRPFRNTTIRMNGEIGDIDSNRPEIRPPGDAYTSWWYMGRPAYNPSGIGAGAPQNPGTSVMLGTPAPGWPAALNSNGTWATTGSNILGPGRSGPTNYTSGQIGALSPASRQMYLVFNDPNSSELNLGLPGMPAVDGMRGGNINFVHPDATGALVTDTFRGVRDMNRIQNFVFHSEDITHGFWKATQITDPAIYDFYNHMLHGPNKYEWARWQSANVTAEQLLFDGRGGIELSANREKLDNGSVLPLDSTISGYTLRIDMNSHLFDGQMNPNFGRPFVTAYSRMNVKSFDRDALRGTAFYDLDLRKTGNQTLGKILGRHRFTASHTRNVSTSLQENGNWFFNNGVDYNRAVMNGTVNASSTAQRGAMMIRYLGPNVSTSPTPATGAITTPVKQWPKGVQDVNLLWYNEPAAATSPRGTWEQRTFNLISAGDQDPASVRRTNNVQYTREKVNSSVAIAQSHWFDSKLVSTLGVRRDHVQTYNAGQPRLTPDGTGQALLDDTYYPRPVTNITESSFNWGVVAHAPNFIQRKLPFGSEFSLLYNRSDNFRPAGQRYNLFNDPIPHETGKTKEYGAMLSTFNGKLVLRAVNYETSSGLSSSLVSSLNPTPINSLSDMIGDVQGEIVRGTNGPARAEGVRLWTEWINSPLGLALQDTFRIEQVIRPNGTSDVTNNRRTGEVVATADVVSKGQEYELIYNPTRSWRMALNVAKAEAVRTNVAPELRRIIFDSLGPLAAGPAGDIRSNETNDASTMRQSFTTIRTQMLPELVNEGAPTSELRKWRWNFMTNYTFAREGFLKNVNIGGAVRWQDKIAIGFPVYVHPEFGAAPDIRNPHLGPIETNYDAWIGYRRKFRHFDWRIQLNVYNIGVGKELIPVSAQPDGSIAGWRIAPEQRWTLRNTFTF
jgi:catecholate siderophore receptor